MVETPMTFIVACPLSEKGDGCLTVSFGNKHSSSKTFVPSRALAYTSSEAAFAFRMSKLFFSNSVSKLFRIYFEFFARINQRLKQAKDSQFKNFVTP